MGGHTTSSDLPGQPEVCLLDHPSTGQPTHLLQKRRGDPWHLLICPEPFQVLEGQVKLSNRRHPGSLPNVGFLWVSLDLAPHGQGRQDRDSEQPLTNWPRVQTRRLPASARDGRWPQWVHFR